MTTPNMNYYDLSAECDACGNTHADGCPVVVDMGMCPSCIFGEWEANQEALADIAAGTAKLAG